MCKLNESHAKNSLETVERHFITVATVPFNTFSEGVHRQMAHHLGKLYSPENILLLLRMKMRGMTDFKQDAQVGN